jgi:hypothetical protein
MRSLSEMVVRFICLTWAGAQSACPALQSSFRSIGITRRVGKGALFAPCPRGRGNGGHAEPVIGPAEGGTRWLCPPYAPRPGLVLKVRVPPFGLAPDRRTGCCQRSGPVLTRPVRAATRLRRQPFAYAPPCRQPIAAWAAWERAKTANCRYRGTIQNSRIDCFRGKLPPPRTCFGGS